MKKSFAILLAMLLAFAMLICACTNVKQPTIDPPNLDSAGGDEVDPDAVGSGEESQSEEETVPYVPLGTQARPGQTQASGDESDTKFELDQNQMAGNEDSRINSNDTLDAAIGDGDRY